MLNRMYVLRADLRAASHAGSPPSRGPASNLPLLLGPRRSERQSPAIRRFTFSSEPAAADEWAQGRKEEDEAEAGVVGAACGACPPGLSVTLQS